MTETKRHGKIPSGIAGGVFLLSLIFYVINIILTITTTTYEDFFWSQAAGMSRIVNYILNSTSMLLFFIAAIAFLALGKGRIIVAVGAMLQFVSYFVYGILSGDILGVFRDMFYIFDNDTFIGLTLFTFVIVFAFVKIRGLVIPIIGYVLTGLYSLYSIVWLFDSLSVYMEYGSDVIYEYETEINPYLIWVIGELAWLLFAVGLILLIPTVLYIPKRKTAPADTAYGTPYTAPVHQPNQIFSDSTRTACKLLKSHGYAVTYGNYELTVVKEFTPDDGVARYFAKADGVYSFSTAPTGGFDIKKCFVDSDFGLMCTMMLSNLLLECMNRVPEIAESAEFAAVVAELKTYENRVMNAVVSADPESRVFANGYFGLMSKF